MRILRAFGRVARAPGLLITVVLIHLALARLVASTVGGALARGLEPYFIPENQNPFYAFLERLLSHPGIGATWWQLMSFSSLFSLLLWTALAGGILYRLDRPAPARRVAARTVHFLPAMFAVTLWHLIPRLVLLGCGGALTGALMKHASPGAWPAATLTLLLLFYATCALDLARASIVVGSARPYAWRTAWRGFTTALARPKVLAASMVFSLAQGLTTVTLVLLAVAGFAADYGPWPARLVSALGIVFGLARMAVAVEAASPFEPRARSRA